MFAYGQLTRARGIDPRSLTFAVVDVETTGLDAHEGARICEIGIVRMCGDGVVLDEYSTLVDPMSPITNDVYHGITDTIVKGSPRFDHIAGDVLAYLDGAIVVGHKLDYEEEFLTAEFGRLGIRLSGIPGLCTLVMARTHLDRHGYRLDEIASLVTGEWPAAAHSALGDARTLAWVLSKFIQEAPTPLSWSGIHPIALPTFQRSGFISPRAAGLRRGTEGWLATLTARLPLMTYPPSPRASGVADYQAMLGHALADGRIVGEEAQQLALLAARAGLTQTTARYLHERFLADVRAQAEADGVVSAAEVKELQKAAKELAATHLIGDLEQAAAADRARKNGPLKGWRILPVADTSAVIEVMDLATANGAAVAVNVTKTVRLVLTDDVDNADPRLVKARAAGIPVVTADEAQELLNREITQAGASLFATARGQEVAEQLAFEHEQLARRRGPEWHAAWRPHALTAAQYKAEFIDPYSDWDPRGSRYSVVVDSPVRTASATRGVPATTNQKSGGCAGLVLLASGLGAVLAEAMRNIIG
ncbi:3'-5' exonuclease [Herbidospora daliensis]|uniref:3'-5' exonuclease n=1 Tax=Herbidospora daliensis TaxID=295585 RepID=UPI000A018691|nr:3'-5' exonuclease [Herbidospora daliensis]